jgi:tetratricopeptide (TPR) repeat protein
MTRRVLFFTISIWVVWMRGGSIATPAPNRVFADSSPDVAQARHQIELGNYSAAVNTLRNAVARNPNDAEAQFWMARAYYELKDFNDAASHAERATQIDPKNSLYHQWLARSYGEQADREHSFSLARKVKKEFEEAVRLNPSNLEARRELEEFNIEAPWIVGGNKDAAREQADAIATVDPVAGHLARAAFYRGALKKNELAENEYRLVLESKVDRIEPYFEIADYYRELGRGADMEAAIQAAEKIKPGDPRIGYYRAIEHILNSTQASAAEPLLKAYLANTPDRSDWPSHASARDWLGRLYEQEGKRQQAAEQYRAALELDPGNKEARAKLQKLEHTSQ